VYLPTAGKDGEWLACLIELEHHITDIVEEHGGNIAVFIRGDLNASSKNMTRSKLFSAFISKMNLTKVILPHLTYHHFTGGGKSDSDLDALLYGGCAGVSEYLVDIVCELKHPLMFSHHDLIISTCSIPTQQPQVIDNEGNISAPRTENIRFRTIWTEEGVAEYKEQLGPLLTEIRQTWGSSPSISNISLLLSSTYTAMNMISKSSNKCYNTADSPKPKDTLSTSVRAAARNSLNELHQLKRLEKSSGITADQLNAAKKNLETSRKLYQKEVRGDLAFARQG
jgi:hypothetical protein